MTVECSKCGREIANAGALRMHEAHCKGPAPGAQAGAPEGAGAAPEKGKTTVKPADSGPSTGQGADSGGETKTGFFQSIEDELNA